MLLEIRALLLRFICLLYYICLFHLGFHYKMEGGRQWIRGNLTQTCFASAGWLLQVPSKSDRTLGPGLLSLEELELSFPLMGQLLAFLLDSRSCLVNVCSIKSQATSKTHASGFPCQSSFQSCSCGQMEAQFQFSFRVSPAERSTAFEPFRITSNCSLRNLAHKKSIRVSKLEWVQTHNG